MQTRQMGRKTRKEKKLTRTNGKSKDKQTKTYEEQKPSTQKWKQIQETHKRNADQTKGANITRRQIATKNTRKQESKTSTKDQREH